jgi:hypothetical protein
LLIIWVLIHKRSIAAAEPWPKYKLYIRDSDPRCGSRRALASRVCISIAKDVSVVIVPDMHTLRLFLSCPGH